MDFKKTFLALAMVFSAANSYGKDIVDCRNGNKKIAQSVINQAAQSIGFKASEVESSWQYDETGDRYEFFIGHIYRASYVIIVKTNPSCFLKEIELIDMVDKP